LCVMVCFVVATLMVPLMQKIVPPSTRTTDDL
jgi:hypothetical protein